MSDKAINFKVDPELYRRVKIRVANEDITVKDYIIKLIQKDLEENEKKE